MKKMNNKGFSLVELIVVIAIMAVLVGVLAPQFIKYVEKSRQSTDVTNLDSIKTVVETYYADKEGDDLPGAVSIRALTSGTTTVYKVYKGADKTAALNSTTPVTEAVDQGGVTDTPIKGKWVKKGVATKTYPSAVWVTADNTWEYEAESDYYTTKNHKIVSE